MKYNDLVALLSEARMSKYNRVTHGNKVKTVQLYHHNLKLSQRLFGVIGMFEVALRNAIYNHYRNSFDDIEWITEQAAPGKLLEHEADEVLRVKNEFIRKGVYSADKMEHRASIITACAITLLASLWVGGGILKGFRV